MTIQIAYQELQLQLQSLYDHQEAVAIANWVIESVTGIQRIDRIVQKDRLLTAAQTESLQACTTELMASRPVQYVLNEAWFAAMKFQVNESVLIPRPETEELVEWILEENKSSNFKSIFEIGTGSGCIPISLKNNCQIARFRQWILVWMRWIWPVKMQTGSWFRLILSIWIF